MIEASDTATDIDVGLAHHEAGRLAEAETVYRRILRQEPDHPEVLNLLGVLLQDTGRLEESIAVLCRAVAVDAGFPEAFANLARAQCAASDPAAAKLSSQRAIELDPDLAEAHLQLARSLLALQDNAGAALAAARAAALAPHSAEAQFFLGDAHGRLQDYPAAAAAYRAADQLAPDQYDTLLSLGTMLSELKQSDEAVRCCRHAATLKPEDPRAHVALGSVLRRAEDFLGSVETLGRALELAPERPEVWRQQGDNFAILGRFDAAADCYQRVLALDPGSSEALSCLATIRKLTNAAGEQARLQAALSNPDCSEVERLSAGFALGSLLDIGGDHAAAFEVYASANRLARESPRVAGAGFDLTQFRRRIDQIRAAFVPEAFQATAGWGDPSDVPVFVVGMPRTGTTLVEQILAAHPRIYGAGERKDVADIGRRLEAGHRRLEPGQWDSATVRREAEAQVARLSAIGRSADRVVDKLPDNILLLGHIAVLFPHARVIICRRDLRDVCLSCYFQLFRDGLAWSYDLADCAARAYEIERLTEHWRAVLPLRMLEVEYEALVGDLEGQCRRMIDFLDLDWDAACLGFDAAERAVQTTSLWQVRQPLYASSVGRWRQYRPYIQPLLDGLFGLVPADGSDLTMPRILAGARAHFAAGRTAPAESAYRLVVEREPDNIEALHRLGQLARGRGDAEEALSLLLRAIAARPRDADLLVELSRVYRVMGDFCASADAAGKAVALDEADASAQFLLGSARLALNDAGGARQALRYAIELAPQSGDAHLHFAMACIGLKDFVAAAAALREAVRLKPNDAESLAKLGRVLGELDQYDEAWPYLHRAIELAPQDGRVHLALVDVLWRAQDVAATEVACERALRIAPEIAGLWLNKGYCEAARGRFAAAGESYRRALTIDPHLDAPRYGLIDGRQDDGQVDLEWLNHVLDDPGKDGRERADAGYALGELLERAGDYDAAWNAYASANQLARASHQAKGRIFDPVAFDRHVEAIMAKFPPDSLLAPAGPDDASELPVFIVGMPRSGTTLVEQIASSHRDVFGAGELRDIDSIVTRMKTELGDVRPTAWDPAVIARERATHLQKLRDLGGNAQRVIDKMPDNLLSLGHIAVLFPHARVIICRRDLRDVGLSCYFQRFSDNLPWSTDLVDIAARERALERLVSHWRRVLPLPILDLQYEDLVHNLEQESRRIIAFLGLDWDAACLEYHQTERAVITASMWQVRQPLYTHSIGRWQHYRRHMQPLIAGLAGLVPAEGDADWTSLAADPSTALAIAKTHHRAGRLDAAEAIYRALLRRNSEDPDALHLLGLLRLGRAEPANAVELITRSLTLRPNAVPALSDLARAHRAAGNAKAAVEAARRAVALGPDQPDANVQLGYALLMQQDFAGAIEALQHAIAMAPDSLEAHTGLATALTDTGDYAAAAEAWQAALALKPDDPGLLIKYAGSLIARERVDEALAVYRQAEVLAPDDPNVHYGIANILVHKGAAAAAAEVCRRAIETTPGWSRLWLLLANCESMLGHFDAAADAYQRALALEPELIDALHDLTALGERFHNDAAQYVARDVLEDRSRPVRDRVAAGFALGRMLDRSGAYDEAFETYAIANRLLRDDRAAHGCVFDRNEFHDLVDRLIAAVDPQTFTDTAGWGDPSDLPVFIVGMPRSGTSLVEQIAASHPLVFGAGEQTGIFEILAALDDGRAVARPAEAWDRQSVSRETTRYVQHLRGLGGHAIRVVDKQLHNILCLGQIAVLFPRARVVVCRRDLRDVGLSCFFRYFRDDALTWADDLADCGFRAREVERLMDHWRNVLPMPILEINYETLVTNLESESRRLIDFLGLEWDPACLAFDHTERTVNTASLWQVRQPLYTSSIGRWRPYSRHLQPLLAELAGQVPADGDVDWDTLATDPATARAIAVSHHKARRIDQAEPIYRALLRRDPDDSTTLHLLGLLVFDRGEPQESIALITRALALRPDVPLVLADLAGAYRAAGNVAAATEAARRAVALDPALPVALMQLGYALLMQQHYDEAIEVLRRSTEVAPSLVETWVALATGLHQSGDYGLAAKMWETALALKPNDPGLLTELAGSLTSFKCFDEALVAYRQAETLAPDDPRVQYGIAGSLLHTGDAATAAELCGRALAKMPDTRFWLLLANCEAVLGHVDAAADACRQALVLDPGSAGALHDLVALGKRHDDDALKQAARSLLEDQSRPLQDRASAGFALGQVCDRSGAYDDAFEAFAHANELLSSYRHTQGFVFNRNKFRDLVERQIATFDPQTFAATAECGDPSEHPVFIVGMPRSGTSLVEQITASHKMVFGAGELMDISRILTALELEHGGHHPASWNRTSVRREATAHAQHLCALGGDAVRVIDKLPDNILCLGYIAVLFPRARIVICRRDLRDVSLSCFFQYFSEDALVWTDDLADCAFRAREVDRLMEHWRKVLPIPVLEVQYETLVADLETESRRLIDFLGLEWDPACLAFHETQRTVMTASHWQVRQPIYARSAGRWRHYRNHLGPMLREFEGWVAADDEAPAAG